MSERDGMPVLCFNLAPQWAHSHKCVSKGPSVSTACCRPGPGWNRSSAPAAGIMYASSPSVGKPASACT
eukprot:4724897-Pyramimonas_sp.AAC.1